MKLYLIRHGQSETNLARKFTGWSQVDLTEKGVEDAHRIRPVLENVKFDKIFSSDLVRAMQTAEAAIPGCTYEITPLLREIKMGSLEMQPIADVLPAMKEQNADAVGYAMFGGESFAEFGARVREFLDMVKTLDCENVAAFTHGGLLTTMLCIVLRTVLRQGTVCCENCTVAVLELRDDNWRLHSWINPV